MMFQAWGRNLLPFNKYIHKWVLVVTGDFLDFSYFFLGVTEWYPDDGPLGSKHVANIKRTRFSFVNSFYLLTDLTRTQRDV
jgi:hypothetical protein